MTEPGTHASRSRWGARTRSAKCESVYRADGRCRKPLPGKAAANDTIAANSAQKPKSSDLQFATSSAMGGWPQRRWPCDRLLHTALHATQRCAARWGHCGSSPQACLQTSCWLAQLVVHWPVGAGSGGTAGAGVAGVGGAAGGDVDDMMQAFWQLV